MALKEKYQVLIYNGKYGNTYIHMGKSKEEKEKAFYEFFLLIDDIGYYDYNLKSSQKYLESEKAKLELYEAELEKIKGTDKNYIEKIKNKTGAIEKTAIVYDEEDLTKKIKKLKREIDKEEEMSKLYNSAKNGDMKSAKVLVENRNGHEYEGYEIDIVYEHCKGLI